MITNNSKLAIIAGSGSLPQMLISACQEQDREFFVVLVKDNALNEDYKNVPHETIHIGYVSQAIDLLKRENIKQVVFAGGINKPSMSSLKVDKQGAILAAKLAGAKLFGDNKVLSTVMNFFEQHGFEVVGVDEVVGDLLMPKGLLGKTKFPKEYKEDIDMGIHALKVMGDLDIGQSIVVQQKQILGVEGVEGTDRLIERCGKLQLPNGRRGVLVKMKKPRQTRRMDLPTIGINTIENIHKAGLAGIAVQAGESLILEKNKVIETADKLGIFVVGV